MRVSVAAAIIAVVTALSVGADAQSAPSTGTPSSGMPAAGPAPAPARKLTRAQRDSVSRAERARADSVAKARADSIARIMTRADTAALHRTLDSIAGAHRGVVGYTVKNLETGESMSL